MTTTIKAARQCMAILLVFALSACATKLGRDFNEAYAKQIKPGESTKAQILERLGQPSLVGGTVEDEVWTYAYYEGEGMFAFNRVGQGKQKRLIVKFKGDSVTESTFRQELPLADRANR